MVRPPAGLVAPNASPPRFVAVVAVVVRGEVKRMPVYYSGIEPWPDPVDAAEYLYRVDGKKFYPG